MHETELLILGLCVAIPTLSVIARLLGIPYPIVLVLGAIPLGYLPGVPDVELDPELVLVIFLPPLLYVAAFFADLRALRADARALSLTSIGLVLVTTCAVAVVGHVLIDLPWAVAFALGAIVSPTDPVAATAITRQLGVPRRLVNLIEGESLVNGDLPDLRGRPLHRRRPRSHAAGSDPQARSGRRRLRGGGGRARCPDRRSCGCETSA